MIERRNPWKPKPTVDRDSRTDLSHDGLKSDVSFFMTTLSLTRRTLEVRSSARDKSEDKQSCVHKCNSVRVFMR